MIVSVTCSHGQRYEILFISFEKLYGLYQVVSFELSRAASLFLLTKHYATWILKNVSFKKNKINIGACICFKSIKYRPVICGKYFLRFKNNFFLNKINTFLTCSTWNISINWRYRLWII